MAIRRATAQVVTFPAIDPSNRPARVTAISFASGDVKISKDGAAFANTTNLPAEIGTTGRYSLSLTAAELDAGWVHVTAEKAGIDPVDVVIGTTGHATGTVQSDAGNSATQFKTDRTEATNDHWKDALVVFTSGSLAGQVKKISAYNGTTKIATVSTAFTGTPANGDRFLLINI